MEGYFPLAAADPAIIWSTLSPLSSSSPKSAQEEATKNQLKMYI